MSASTQNTEPDDPSIGDYGSSDASPRPRHAAPAASAAREPLHVAVGVVVNRQGEVLIARRNDRVHQGGLWEFPGGKVEPGERIEDALQRELLEELAITVESATPLIKISHTYPDAHVLLDVWRVDSFSGEARGVEGQPIAWVPIDTLSHYPFPEANLRIATAIRLPTFYAILDYAIAGGEIGMMRQLDTVAARGITLVQLRAKSLSVVEYGALARRVCRRGEAAGVGVLLNATCDLVEAVGAAGVHLTSRRLQELSERPLPSEYWVAASCHSQNELLRAQKMGVDFAVLGPVMATNTHPEARVLGWEGFESLVSGVNIPVYALGGLGPEQLCCARHCGAQGVAGIRAFLS